MDTLNTISLLVALAGVTGTIAGVAGTVYFGRKSISSQKEIVSLQLKSASLHDELVSLQKRMKRFEWPDVELGVKYLHRVVSDKFSPDCILTISAPGGIVANLFVTHHPEILPIYTAITLKESDSRSLDFATDHHLLTTAKWKILIPDAILRHKEKRILILDGSVITGDAMSYLLDLLKNEGFKRENILAAALVSTEVAIDSRKGPDVYWTSVPDSHYYMPWGHLMGPGY